MDFYSLLPFLHPTPLTCSLLPYRLVHQMHMFSVILNFFGWPVSWTWCHHWGPISHLALLRVVHQAHALSSWLLQQLLNLNGTSHCRTWDLASQHSLQKAWITHSGSMKGLAFHGANFAPKKIRNGMSLNKGLPSYGFFFKINLLNTDSPEAFHILSGSLAGLPVFLHRSSWSSSPQSNVLYYCLTSFFAFPPFSLTSATLGFHLANKASTFNPCLKLCFLENPGLWKLLKRILCNFKGKPLFNKIRTFGSFSFSASSLKGKEKWIFIV